MKMRFRSASNAFECADRQKWVPLLTTIQRTVGYLKFCAILGVCCLLVQEKLLAQLTVLHSFGDGTVPNDGVTPIAGLIQAPDGNLYGTTIAQASGTTGLLGTIFRLTPGGAVTIIASFERRDVAAYVSLLFYQGHRLIGVSQSGGIGAHKRHSQLGNGEIFRVGANSGIIRTWHRFGDGTVPDDGLNPSGSLILGPDGSLYGTTFGGGSNSMGTAYKIDPVTKQVTVLHSFGNSDGSNPGPALLLAKDGNFYGITERGTIFKMTPSGDFTILYSFPSTYVGTGAPLIQDAAGNFYGTTHFSGSANLGTVFKMTPQYVVSILHSFGQGKDGSSPDAAVVFGPNGNLYGTTDYGGTANRGTIFELAPDGSSYSILHNFDDGSVSNDGIFPMAPVVVGSNNNLYGTTSEGGSVGSGVVFRISP